MKKESSENLPREKEEKKTKPVGNKNKFILRQNVIGSVTDPLRAFHGNVWGAENGEVKINPRTYISKDRLLSQIPINFSSKNSFKLDDQVLSESIPFGTFYDFNFEVPAPFIVLEGEQPGIKNSSISTKIELESHFNYYNNEFNKFCERSDIGELDLPNFYLFLAKDAKTTDEIEQIITNGFRIDDALLDNSSSAREYFTKYALTFDSWRDEYNKSYKEKLRTIIFDTAQAHKYLSLVDKAKLFTNYIKIDLHKEKTGRVGDALLQTGLDLKLLSQLIGLSENLLFLAEKRQESVVLNTETIPGQYSVKNEDVKYLDFMSWLSSVNSDSIAADPKFFDFTGSEDYFYVGTRGNEEAPTAQDQSFINSLMPKILLGKINKLITENNRSFKDITDGQPCYTEVLGFKLVKSKVGLGTIQEYYFQNTKDDVLSFIDAQTINGQEYTYSLYHYVLAIGSKYKYNLKGRYIDAITEPLVYIFEIKTSEITAAPKIELAPPIAPIVTPIPYKEIQNKIKFNLKQNIDKYRGEFLLLEPEDGEILNRILSSQRVRDPKKIHFEIADEYFNKYEIYRLDVEPRSYSDFAGKRMSLLDGDSFIDTLENNKKYYYMFRTVSATNLKSNPSVIYEIELILNSGAHYPNIRVFNFKQNAETQKKKAFKKKLSIQPSFNQFIASESSNYNVSTDTPELGIGPVIWNKDYKLRITSKQTGRKIDVNFKMYYGPSETEAVFKNIIQNIEYEKSLDFSIYCNNDYQILI